MKTINFSAIILASSIASCLAIPAFAQNANTPNIDQRQANQQARIAKGINSGALTAQESANLEKREAKIEADKQMAKADGKVTREERLNLQREENRASKKIYAKKHNARSTAPAGN